MWRADYEKAGVNIWANADAYGSSYPGEASWILPLKDGKPSATFTGATGYAPTIKLKWLRDGVDTYDYLMMLQEGGQGTFADSVTATVASSFTGWSKDPAAIEAARRQLGENLSGPVAPLTYTLTLVASPSNGGTVTGSGTYTEGEAATITATPAYGYTFSHWDGDATGADNPATVAMTADKEATATFTACALMRVDSFTVTDSDGPVVAYDTEAAAFTAAEQMVRAGHTGVVVVRTSVMGF
jgi:hypothetical protein